MKCSIDSDEWYPVHSFYPTDHGNYELPDDFAERYKKCMKEFNELQDIMSNEANAVHQKEHEERKKIEDVAYKAAQEALKKLKKEDK